MADAGARIYGPAQPGTSNATLYTSTGVTTAIRHIRICNTTGTAATITLAIAGTSATAANHIYSAFSVPANGVEDWSGFMWLASGETLTGLQGTTSALTVTISGVTT
jgi:hypothetical protein